MIHAGRLILPHAMSDLATSIAIIDLQELLDSLTPYVSRCGGEPANEHETAAALTRSQQ
jgi:hypothetical protein